MDMLNLIRDNFKIAGRVNFLHRIIYIGEHKFTSGESNLQEFVADNIKTVNDDYCDEVLSGFMLCYPNHFIHLLEGSEDTLLRHLTALYASEEPRLGCMKLVLVSHHIKQRLYPIWSAKHCQPPATIDKLDPQASTEDIAGYVLVAVRKLYGLADFIRRQSVNQLRVMMNNLTESVPTYLPESALVDFLLTINSPIVMDLKEYVDNYATVPPDSYYQEKVWPAMCDFIPYNPYEVEEEEAGESGKT